MKARIFAPVLSLAACLLGTAGAQAQLIGPQGYILETQAFLSAGNDFNTLTWSGDYSPTGGFVETTSPLTKSFTGLDRNGDLQTMTQSGYAKAKADFGRLKVYASGKVENTYYNSANEKYRDYITGGLNPAGSPDLLQNQGVAVWGDTLKLNAFTDGVVSLRYLFKVDGSITGDYSNVYLAFRVGAQESLFFADQGAFDHTWATAPYVIAGSTVQMRGQFGAFMQVYTNFPQSSPVPDGSNFSGVADAYSTLNLDGIELLDANGNRVNGVGYDTASGAQYNVLGGFFNPNSVPEPGSIALLVGVVGGGLVLRRRRA